jgi:predicted Ser/Thr protein kinase
MYLPAHSLEGKKLGTYRIGRPLGRGGMGEVYLAHDEALDRLVAIKTLVERFAHDQAFIKRFQREARAVAKLNHPNIVQVYAVDVASKPPYLAMEFIDGVSLDTQINPENRFPWQRALSICGQVAAALQAAHTAGIIHRDIKPQNILIDRSMRVRVTDFGIAKILDSASSLTSADMTVGSPFYMSPEQCGVGEVVPASDLFSLGITTFEMIAGGLPFQGETALALMRKITEEPLPPLTDFAPDTPPVVQAFVDLLTAKTPRERYPSAAAVLEDLNLLRNGKLPPRLASRAVTAHTPAYAVPTMAAGIDLQLRGTTQAPAMRQALVADLMDDPGDPFRKAPPKVRAELSIPWPLILGVGAVVLVALLLWPLYNRLQQAPATPVAAPISTPTAAPAAATAPALDPNLFKGPPPPPPGFPPPPQGGGGGPGGPGGPGGQRPWGPGQFGGPGGGHPPPGTPPPPPPQQILGR